MVGRNIIRETVRHYTYICIFHIFKTYFKIPHYVLHIFLHAFPRSYTIKINNNGCCKERNQNQFLHSLIIIWYLIYCLFSFSLFCFLNSEKKDFIYTFIFFENQINRKKCPIKHKSSAYSATSNLLLNPIISFFDFCRP